MLTGALPWPVERRLLLLRLQWPVGGAILLPLFKKRS